MKIIFIHIAKNCGNSIKRLLSKEKHLELCHCFKLFHTNNKLLDYENKLLDLTSYFKFTIVRNPWDRLVSYYAFKKDYLHSKIKFRELIEKKYNSKIENIDDNIIIKELKKIKGLEYNDEYIKLLKKLNMLQNRIDEIKNKKKNDIDKYQKLKKTNFKDFWLKNLNSLFLKNTQVKYLKCKNIKNEIDLILRYENLNDDFKKLSEKLKITNKLEKKNYSKHKHYSEYYDDEIKKILYPYIKEDLDYFNYKF